MALSSAFTTSGGNVEQKPFAKAAQKHARSLEKRRKRSTITRFQRFSKSEVQSHHCHFRHPVASVSLPFPHLLPFVAIPKTQQTARSPSVPRFIRNLVGIRQLTKTRCAQFSKPRSLRILSCAHATGPFPVPARQQPFLPGPAPAPAPAPASRSRLPRGPCCCCCRRHDTSVRVVFIMVGNSPLIVFYEIYRYAI